MNMNAPNAGYHQNVPLRGGSASLCQRHSYPCYCCDAGWLLLSSPEIQEPRAAHHSGPLYHIHQPTFSPITTNFQISPPNLRYHCDSRNPPCHLMPNKVKNKRQMVTESFRKLVELLQELGVLGVSKKRSRIFVLARLRFFLVIRCGLRALPIREWVGREHLIINALELTRRVEHSKLLPGQRESRSLIEKFRRDKLNLLTFQLGMMLGCRKPGNRLEVVTKAIEFLCKKLQPNHIGHDKRGWCRMIQTENTICR